VIRHHLELASTLWPVGNKAMSVGSPPSALDRRDRQELSSCRLSLSVRRGSMRPDLARAAPYASRTQAWLASAYFTRSIMKHVASIACREPAALWA
jgi:hypothetical protein